MNNESKHRLNRTWLDVNSLQLRELTNPSVDSDIDFFFIITFKISITFNGHLFQNTPKKSLKR